jgi:hypothetical protein
VSGQARVLGAVTVETACRRIPADRAAISPEGTVTDPRFKADLAEVWDALLGHLAQL